MLLYIGLTGGGKSTSLKLFRELSKLIPKISNGIKTEDNSSLQGLIAGISQEPISLLVYDEISQLFEAMKTKQGNFAGAPELLTKMYSDDYVGKPFFRRLASGVKDPVSGVRLSILGMTNQNIFNYMSPELYEQGFMRRFLPMVDTSLKLQKRKWSPSKEFFTEEEKSKITAIVRGLLGTAQLKTKINIERYNLLKGMDQKGQPQIWKDCWQGIEPVTMTATPETDQYLSDDLIVESNNILRALSAGTDVLRMAAMRSYVENIIKFSAIHSLCGKNCLSETVFDGKKMYKFNLNTVVGRDSVDWAKSNIVYWFISDGMDKINTRLSKDDFMDQMNLERKNFLEYLKNEKITEFKQSDKRLKAFFSSREKRKSKTYLLQSLIDDNKIKSSSQGNTLHRGAILKVVDNGH